MTNDEILETASKNAEEILRLERKLLDAQMLIKNIHYLSHTLMAEGMIIEAINKRTAAYIARECPPSPLRKETHEGQADRPGP